jgi:hypothetical protein
MTVKALLDIEEEVDILTQEFIREVPRQETGTNSL